MNAKRFICTWCLLCSVASAAGVDEQNETSPRQVAGYRGIWFTLGQFYGQGTGDRTYSDASKVPVFPYGDKYSGGMGTYTAKHRPMAVYCAPVQKTFFVYGGTTDAKTRRLLCMISFYDHQSGRVPRPVVVHDKQHVDDPHDNPSLAIDDQGYLWVFVSGRARSRPGFKYRSVAPYSIEQFERVSQEEMTYPQPHYIRGAGFLHCFTKYTGVRELYWETSVGGRAWSEDRKLAGIRASGDQRGGHYQVTEAIGSRIGAFFNRHPNGNVDQRTDLYYVETSDFGATWNAITGEKVATPLVDVNNPCRAVDYAAQGLNVYLKDMAYDAQGRPVVLHVTSRGHEPGPPNDPRQFRVTRWTGDAWRTTTICRTDHNYDMGSLYIGPGQWTAILPSAPGPTPYHGGGELVRWVSTDQGESWAVDGQLTHRSPRNHNYARRPLHAKDPFYVFWADGDPTQLSPSRLYFSDSTGTVVRRLPYEMSGQWAEPETAASIESRSE